jgi:tRNA(Ile)-lysidine synthase
VVLRAREAGDAIRLPGGTKSLKKLFIDKKIPASQRLRIPVIGDEAGVLAVYGFGVNLDRKAEILPGLQITFETLTQDNE